MRRTASPNSSIRSSAAAAASTATAKPIGANTRTTCGERARLPAAACEPSRRGVRGDAHERGRDGDLDERHGEPWRHRCRRSVATGGPAADAALNVAAIDGAEREPPEAHRVVQRQVQGQVDGDGDDADDDRRPGVAQRVETRRRDLHDRVAEDAGRVEEQRLQRVARGDARRTRRSRSTSSMIGRPSTIRPTVAGTLSMSISRRLDDSVRRISPCALVGAACRARSGSAAVATDTPMMPIGRYISRNAYESADTAPSVPVASTVLTNRLICAAATPMVPGPISTSTSCKRRIRGIEHPLMAVALAPERRPLHDDLRDAAEQHADRQRRDRGAGPVADTAGTSVIAQMMKMTLYIAGDERRDEEALQRVQHAHVRRGDRDEQQERHVDLRE